MTVVNPKRISGINSITTGSGSDNLLTIHTSDASSTERVRINSSGDVIVGSGITVSPDGDIFATGITTVGTGLSMADNVPASFGDSGDLKISHNGSDSLLQDSGTGNLKLISNGSGIILEKSNAEPMVRAYTDGAVELFHDNSKKLETTSDGVTVTGDFSIDDKIVHTGDTNTAIRFPAADTITAETGGSERVRIDSSGKLLVGTSSDYAENVQAAFYGASNGGIALASGTSGSSRLMFADGTSGSGTGAYIGSIIYAHSDDSMRFTTNVSERFRITSDGKSYFVGNTSGGFSSATLPNGNTVNINTKVSNDGVSVIRYSGSYAAYALNIGRSKSDTIGTNSIVADGDDLGHITWYGADGTDFNQAAAISVQVDGSPSDGTDMPGRFVFKTSNYGSGTPTERVRITAGGRLMLDYPTATQDSSNSRISAFGNSSTATGAIPISVHCGNVGSGRYMVVFFNGNGHVGSIITSGSSTTYETTSDYRLKENAVTISDGITRLKTLKPYRFNFKSDSSTTVDGFFAHEVTAVPEAISGTKDAVVTQDMIDAFSLSL